MSYVQEQADWLRLCEVAGLSDSQTVLLESVLAACDPDVVLTRHVAGARTAVSALAHTHAAIESRARPTRKKLQPHLDSTKALVNAALTLMESVRSGFTPGTLTGAISTLSAFQARPDASLGDAAACSASAAELATRIAEVRAAVIGQFTTAWQTPRAAPEVVARVALEMAAIFMLEGRSHRLLTDDVRTAMSRRPVGADPLLAVLLPAKQEFPVAVVVEGTSALRSITELMDPAAVPVEIAARAPNIRWGGHPGDLKALAAHAENAAEARRDWSGDQPSGYVLLAFTVRACDAVGAALLGRRQVSEALDQYVAGQRVAEIRLRPESLVHDPRSGRARRLAVPVLGTGLVKPLTAMWPLALRESLRTAHIARATEAPMTAAGLCWVALEALDVGPNSQDRLAQALSLQALRQQIVDLHNSMRTAVAAMVKVPHDAYRAGQRKADALNTALATASAKATVEPAALATRAAAARAAVLDLRTALDQTRELQAHLTAVDAWTGGGNGTLRQLDRWLDVLIAPADAAPELRAVADTMTTLIDRLGGETGARLRTWRALLTDPASLATWLEDTKNGFETSLKWLYAVRNTALHDGRFTSATDMLDAHAGRALVDTTLEFLGNWYEHASPDLPDQAAWPAIRVIYHLAARQETGLAELRRSKRTGLHATHLTSPTAHEWDPV